MGGSGDVPGHPRRLRTDEVLHHRSCTVAGPLHQNQRTEERLVCQDRWKESREHGRDQLGLWDKNPREFLGPPLVAEHFLHQASHSRSRFREHRSIQDAYIGYLIIHIPSLIGSPA